MNKRSLTNGPCLGHNRATMSHTTTIKFNVSDKFKELAQAKADEVGFSLSDLGRFLFGAYIHGDIITPPKQTLDELYKEGMAEYKAGKTISVNNPEELKEFLDSIK